MTYQSYYCVLSHLPKLGFLQQVCISFTGVVELSEVLQQVLQSSSGVLTNQLDTETTRGVDMSDIHTQHLGVLREGLLGVGG